MSAGSQIDEKDAGKQALQLSVGGALEGDYRGLLVLLRGKESWPICEVHSPLDERDRIAVRFQRSHFLDLAVLHISKPLWQPASSPHPLHPP